MWIIDYLSKSASKNAEATCGSVVHTNNGTVSVNQSSQHLGLPVVAPYGIAYNPPLKENSVVLPAQNINLCMGVVAPDKNLASGEIMLYSSGGAYIHLKNDGTIVINGQTFGG